MTIFKQANHRRTQKVSINQNQATKIGEIIKSLHFVHPVNLGFKSASQESKLFQSYILVGIYHQINWNFLLNSLTKLRKDSSLKFTPEYLVKISHRELMGWLSGYPRKERLNKSFKRAELVRNLCKVLLKEYDGKVMNLVKKAGGKIGGETGIYALLKETIAYGEDPLFKKASVFIDVVDDLGLVSFSDWKNYIPPIDYHIVRILLRSGTIKILNKELVSKLFRYSPVSKREDLPIRSAAIKAINFIAGKNPKNRKTIQGLFWRIGRECCHEGAPRCQSCMLNKCSCKEYISASCRSGCFLKEACYSFQGNQSFLKIREQNFISTWY